ncbi:MAG: nucleotidyltransferase [Desulfurococcales archaeon]|nr:nucleotidyltransferase [Desulfurococcales archaeon]
MCTCVGWYAVGFSRRCLGEVLSNLREHGAEGVIIGSTTYQLKLGWKELQDDVDLFATSFSPSFDEDLLLEAADRLSCFVGRTSWDTPQLRCSIDDCEVIVEFYENIYDFYVPAEIVKDADEEDLDGFRAKVIKVEDYALLKAKAGRGRDLEDLRFLGDLVKSGKLKLNKDLIRDRVALFDPEDRGFILRRLHESGII